MECDTDHLRYFMIAEIRANNNMVLKVMPLCCVNVFFPAFAHLSFVFLEISLNVSKIHLSMVIV